MALIRTINDLDIKAPSTYISNDEVAGTTTIRAKNTTGLTTGWAFQIGKTGEDKTEVVFEKSATGTAGTATPITNGTIEYQADALDRQTGQSYTIFDDTSGTSTDAYKTYFRNSALALNSLESNWIIPTGLTFYSLGKLRQRIREKLWQSDFASDDEIDNWINEWKDEMTNAAISVNEDYAIGTVNVAFGSDGLGTITTADFKQPKRIEITYNGADYFLSTKRSLNEYYPSEVVNSAHPYHNWEGDTIIHVMPSDDAGTAKIWFYRGGTPMVNDTDELPLEMRSYTNSFVNHGLGMAYQKDGQTTAASTQFVLATAAKNQFTVQITPRDKTGPTYVKIVEVLSGEDNLVF